MTVDIDVWHDDCHEEWGWTFHFHGESCCINCDHQRKTRDITLADAKVWATRLGLAVGQITLDNNERVATGSAFITCHVSSRPVGGF